VPAGSSLIPSGISASNTFRLLFIASTRWNGTSSDIADYNSFVQTWAKAGHSGIRDACGNPFKAVGSAASVNARENTDSESTDTDAAIYWLGNNEKAADNHADFYDGSWDGRQYGG